MRDRFAEERLPPPERMPAVLLEGLEYPERLNAAVHLLDRRVAAVGAERRCILAPGNEVWTYGRLLESANRIAHALVDDLALEPGNRVLLRAPNTPMLAACWFAVLKAGGVAVTTMPLYRAGELRFMMEKAQVKHALCDLRLRDELERACEHHRGVRLAYFGGAAPGATSLERLAAGKPDVFDNVGTSAEDVALIAFTSGTTGTPKAAMHYHRDVLAICDTYCARVLQPRSDDVFCGSPPLGFTFGLGGLLLFPLHAGAATLLLEKAGPNELLAAIEEFGITTLFTAPLAYRAMAGALDGRDISALRTCVSAGETLPKAVWEEWQAKTGLKILDGIGSTEMLHIFVGSPQAEVRGGSTGRAVPGYVAEVHDESGRSVPDGTVGRLAVRGPTGCKYLQDDRQETYVQQRLELSGRRVSPRCRRLLLVRRPRRRHDRLGRLQHLRSRGRTGADRARRREGGCGRRKARSAEGDELRQGVRRPGRGLRRRQLKGRGASRVLQGADCAVQGAARNRIRNVAAAYGNRQAPTLQTPRLDYFALLTVTPRGSLRAPLMVLVGEPPAG